MHRSASAVAAVVFVVSAFLAPSAGASQVSYDGQAVTYTAAPGESNSVVVVVSPYDTSCSPVATPCLTLFDSFARIAPGAGCALTYSGLGGDTAACPIPEVVRADLGDGEDLWADWDGPSVIDAGTGNDSPIFGEGGNDEIRGGAGNDVLLGGSGDDKLDGGVGDDYLEGIPGGVDVGTDTTGADTYVGGGGLDSLTYERRTEDLALSPDGVANDGAPGEGDDIATDITGVYGGTGSDTFTGNAERNWFGGGTGDDTLLGAGGDDSLYGGTGSDRLDGGPGTDTLRGDDGDDTLVGGPDVDTFYGESPLAVGSGGRDTIDSRDGNVESIHCGPGIDSARIDASDYVTGSWWGLDDQCESIDGAAPAAVPAGAPAGLAIAGASGRAGRLVVRLTVPGPGTAVVTATAINVGRIARGRASASAAGPLRLALKPTGSARRALRRRALRVTVKVAFTPTGGTVQHTRKAATVRLRA